MGYSLVLIGVMLDSGDTGLEMHMCKADGLREAEEELKRSFDHLGKKFQIRALYQLSALDDDSLTRFVYNMMSTERDIQNSPSNLLANLLAASFVLGWHTRDEAGENLPEKKSPESSASVPGKGELN